MKIEAFSCQHLCKWKHRHSEPTLAITLASKHYIEYILKSCKTKQTWGSVNFWCCQETTETLFFIDRQALTLDNTTATARMRLRSRLYVLANGSLCLL